MIRRYARLLSAYPAFGLVFVLVSTVILAVGLPRLGFDMHPNAAFRADNDVSRDLSRFHDVFGPDDNDIVAMIDGDRVLQWESLQALRTFCDRVEALDDVLFVASIFDLNKPGSAVPLIPAYATSSFDPERLRRDLLRHPVSASQLISEDGQTLILMIRIKGESLSVSDLSRVINPLQAYSDDYEAATGTTVRLAGHPAVRVDVLLTLRRSMLFGCSVAVAIGFVIAMLVFRHLPSVIISMAAPAIGTIWTMGLLAWYSVPISGLMTALPNLVFVIGLTDAVHLLLETQRQLHSGIHQRTAVYNALVRVGPACFLASLTTFIGFGSLALSRTESVQQFGVCAALGTTLAMLAVVIVLPTILSFIPRHWAVDDKSEHLKLGHFIQRLVAPALSRPAVTSVVAVVLCLVLLYPAIRQRPDIIWTETMPRHSASVVAMDQADREFGGALFAYLVVGWPQDQSFPNRQLMQAASDAHSAFRDAPGFSAPFSLRNLLAVAPGDTLKERYQAIRNRQMVDNELLISESDRALVVYARVPNDGSSSLRDRLVLLNEKLDQLRARYPDYHFTLTGTAVAAAENMTAIIVDLARSLAIAAVLIFFVLSIAFRSITIGLLTIVPNILPLLVTAAGLTFLGMPLQITSALTFSLCLGLAVDDTIHVVSRYRLCLDEHRCKHRAIEDTICHVGPALVVTTLILLGGFAAIMTSPMPGVQLFASLCGVTLVVALVGDLCLFPAMLVWADKSQIMQGAGRRAL